MEVNKIFTDEQFLSPEERNYICLGKHLDKLHVSGRLGFGVQIEGDSREIAILFLKKKKNEAQLV